MHRSVSADLELEAGTYSVLMKVTAKRYPERATPEAVVKEYSKLWQDKLLMIGMAYDLAHAKAQIKETEYEKALREQREKKKAAAAHKKQREELRAQRYKGWLHDKKQHERKKRQSQKDEERRRKKAEKSKAAGVAEDTAKAAPTASDNPMPPVNGDTPTSEDQTTGGAVETKPLATVPELPSPPTEAETRNSKPAEADIADKDRTTEDKVKQFNQALSAIPQLNINGATVPADAASTNSPPPSTAAAEGDYDSDISFDSSIDTELDFPDGAALQQDDVPTAAAAAAADDDEDDAEFENDPWNAVCIVGLMVYSKDPELSLQIVRPKNEDEDEETPLDVDDPSKGASEEPVPGAV